MMRSAAVLCALLAGMLAAQQSSRVERAWKLVADGHRVEAASLLRDVVRETPQDADARLLLGSILMEAGDRESLDQLAAAVKLRPRSAEAHNALGEAYNAFGDAQAARPEFQRAVELDPRHAQAQANLGAAILQGGDHKAAIGPLDRAIRLFGDKPDAAYPLYLRAKISMEERDAAQASTQLQKAVSLRPDFAEAWSDLGEARRNLDDNQGAAAALRRAVELSPEDSVARTRLGSILLDSGQPHQAASSLREAVRLDPKNQSALNALQLALRRDGHPEEADAVKKQLAQVLRQRDRTDQSLVAAIELNNQGAELEKNGDLRAALEKYRAALALLPEHVGIRTNLAVALLKLGSWDEGIAQMREALQRDPHNAQLKAALDDALVQYHSSHTTRP